MTRRWTPWLFLVGVLLGLGVVIDSSAQTSKDEAGQPPSPPQKPPAPPPSPSEYNVQVKKALTTLMHQIESAAVKVVDYDALKAHYFAPKGGGGLSSEEVLNSMPIYQKGMETLKGRRFKHALSNRIVTKEEFAKYLDNGLIALTWVERSADLQDKFKYFRLIPSTYNLVEGLRPVLEDDLTVLYDFHTKDMLFLEWKTVSELFVHLPRVLATVLVDQHYQLKDLAEQWRGNNDARYALDALLQGDGIFSQVEYGFVNRKVEVTNFEVAEQIAAELEERMRLYHQQYAIPMSVLAHYFYPKLYGVRFFEYGRRYYPQERLFSVYSRLPNSMEKVIHPEKHFNKRHKDNPTRLIFSAEVENALAERKWRLVERTVLGEFFFQLLLMDAIGQKDALNAASGWDGDLMAIYARSETERGLVLFSVWDSIEDASEAYAGFQKSFLGFYRGTKYQVLHNSTELLHLSLADTEVKLKRKGRYVLVLQGFPGLLTAQLEAAFN